MTLCNHQRFDLEYFVEKRQLGDLVRG
jgi:hypothetical protein